MTINFICGVIAELFDSPCNFSPIDEYMFQDNICETHCGEVADKDCWKRYFEKRWEDSKMSEIPNCSEKPNNCETCGTPKHLCQYCIAEDRMWTPQTEPSDCDDPLPTALNGIKIADAVMWADKWLKDNDVSEMWNMIRTLRDAMEWQMDVPKNETQTDDLKAVTALQEHFGIKREPMLSEMFETEPQTEDPPMDEYYKDHDEFYEPQTDCAWKKGK